MVTAFSGRVVSSVACSCSTTALSVVVVTSLVVVTSAALTAENAAALVIIAIARAAVRFFIVWSPCSNAAPTQTKLDQFTAIRKKRKYQRRWYVLPLPARRAALPSKGIGPDRSGQRGHAAGEQRNDAMTIGTIILIILIIILLGGFSGIGGGPFYGTGYYGGGGLGLVIIILLVLILMGRI